MSFPSLPALAPARLSQVYGHPDNAGMAQEAFNYMRISVTRWLSRFPGLASNRGQFNAIHSTLASTRQLCVYAELYGMGAKVILPPGANPDGRKSDKVLSQAFKAYAWGIYYDCGGQPALDEWIARFLDYYRQANPYTDWVIAINNFVAASSSTA
ncbi:hypothetical protein CALCODRAFT_516379 [Calocera cornea HHB12733]|uniref:RNase III domain-containing protein n=1 Tax=Calocera cornea HHB12733 TaxID=1353952 RepID=A0A165H7K0_9BASI|nr:hypothetical protein CALCODRAFT_516379 [Calocera cornea HHB12733]